MPRCSWACSRRHHTSKRCGGPGIPVDPTDSARTVPSGAGAGGGGTERERPPLTGDGAARWRPADVERHVGGEAVLAWRDGAARDVQIRARLGRGVAWRASSPLAAAAAAAPQFVRGSSSAPPPPPPIIYRYVHTCDVAQVGGADGQREGEEVEAVPRLGQHRQPEDPAPAGGTHRHLTHRPPSRRPPSVRAGDWLTQRIGGSKR
jgi:hypothetical protein